MQLTMPFANTTSYHAADYVRGEANAAACDAVERWPDWPYSLLLMYGVAGSGKTHLAHVFAARANAAFIPPQRVGMATADQILTGHHAWVLDDVEAVTDESALAQLINHVRARGDYLLLTARVPVPLQHWRLPDLTSRLRALPAIGLDTPDDCLMGAVIAKLAADLQLRIPPEVVGYLMTHLERSYDAISAAVSALDAASLAMRKPVTVALARGVISLNGG